MFAASVQVLHGAACRERVEASQAERGEKSAAGGGDATGEYERAGEGANEENVEAKRDQLFEAEESENEQRDV